MNFYFVKVHRCLWATDHSLEVILYAIFKAPDAQRVTQIGVKDANICARINPAFDGFRWRRVTIAKTHIQDGRPRPQLLRECWSNSWDWKDLAVKFQGDNTRIDQSPGTFTTTGSGSPFSSARATTSSYDLPYATTLPSSEENAAQPSGGAARSALIRASGVIPSTWKQYAP